MKRAQILQEVQAIVARTQGPVENRQVDGVLVGQRQGRLRVVGGEDVAIEPGTDEPFTEGPPHRLFVIDNQNGLSGAWSVMRWVLGTIVAPAAATDRKMLTAWTDGGPVRMGRGIDNLNEDTVIEGDRDEARHNENGRAVAVDHAGG